MILINIVCVLALAVILWPLLVISKYNYPSADDWSYGVNTYRAIQNHEGVFQFLKTVYETVRNDENRKKYSSRLPGLFTALSFVVYSSQATATIYRAYRMWRNG